MIRLAFLHFAFYAGILPVVPMNAQSPQLPARLKARDLNGRSVTFPRDLAGKTATLLLIAFEREQQEDLDSWIEGLKLREGTTPWWELPVINNPGAIGRWFINTGMRRGIPDRESRAHVVTIYTNRAAFIAALGLPGESEVHVVVVDAAGQRRALASGPFDESKAAVIRRVLESVP